MVWKYDGTEVYRYSGVELWKYEDVDVRWHGSMQT